MGIESDDGGGIKSRTSDVVVTRKEPSTAATGGGGTTVTPHTILCGETLRFSQTMCIGDTVRETEEGWELVSASPNHNPGDGPPPPGQVLNQFFHVNLVRSNEDQRKGRVGRVWYSPRHFNNRIDSIAEARYYAKIFLLFDVRDNWVCDIWCPFPYEKILPPEVIGDCIRITKTITCSRFERRKKHGDRWPGWPQ